MHREDGDGQRERDWWNLAKPREEESELSIPQYSSTPIVHVVQGETLGICHFTYALYRVYTV